MRLAYERVCVRMRGCETVHLQYAMVRGARGYIFSMRI